MDIQGSTEADRTDPVKQRLRQELYRLLDQALVGAGVGERHLDSPGDRGDGFLLLRAALHAGEVTTIPTGRSATRST